MLFRHKSVKPVKAYLLGLLGAREANLLEDRYFVDPAYFRYVRTIEDQLIRDYLDGRLSAGDRERFESRYRTVPELKRRLEEVNSAPRPTHGAVRRRILATSVCLILFVVAVTVFMRTRQDSSGSAIRKPSMPAVLTIYLSPGQTKTAGSGVSFTPPIGGRVNLVLELPGRRETISCRVVLGVVAPDSRRQVLWTSQALISEITRTGGRLSVQVESTLLRPADYIAQVTSEDGGTLWSYSFRVNATQ